MTDRICSACGEPLPAGSRHDRKWCSKRCSLNGLTACSLEGCERASRAYGLCGSHYNRQYHPDRAHTNVDLDRKRERDREWTRRRRALSWNAEAERVHLPAVAERDSWHCGICRRKVNSALLWPDPQSPSLDHIIPLSQGGPHTYANTRLAHLRCNMLRSNRGGGEQLALSG